MGPGTRALGAGELVLNSIDTDGVREGCNIPSTRASRQLLRSLLSPQGRRDHGALLRCAHGWGERSFGRICVSLGVIGIRELKEYLEGRGVPVRRV